MTKNGYGPVPVPCPQPRVPADVRVTWARRRPMVPLVRFRRDYLAMIAEYPFGDLLKTGDTHGEREYTLREFSRQADGEWYRELRHRCHRGLEIPQSVWRSLSVTKVVTPAEAAALRRAYQMARVPNRCNGLKLVAGSAVQCEDRRPRVDQYTIARPHLRYLCPSCYADHVANGGLPGLEPESFETRRPV